MKNVKDRQLLGTRMRRFREIAGLSLELAARKCNMTPEHLKLVEEGSVSMFADDLYAVARAYNVHPFFLLSPRVTVAKFGDVAALCKLLATFLHSLETAMVHLPMLEPMFHSTDRLTEATQKALAVAETTPVGGN